MRLIWCFAVALVATLAASSAIASPPAARSQYRPTAQSTATHNHVMEVYGWFDNPTPQNMWLDAASTQWTISIQGPYQGGYEAKGNWAWPQFQAGQWVHTNGGDYGYGCVRLRGVFNKATNRVVRIDSIKGLMLRTCRQNPALRAKEPYNPEAA